MINTNNLLIGADPEMFFKVGDNYQPAGSYIVGTKENPVRRDGWQGAMQVDGLAAEFNIDPCSTEDEFTSRIGSMIKNIEVIARRPLVADPVAVFGFKRMASFPSHWVELGCNPDWNAWTEKLNPMPDAAYPFRTGSGHIHIGWTNDAEFWEEELMQNAFSVTRHLDYYLGIHSLLWDADPTRRQLYGKAGAFRPKPYGIEYRVMSNAWLKSTDLMRWVFRTTRIAMKHYTQGIRPVETYGDLARQIIDNNETDWLDKYGDIVGIVKPPVVEVS